MVTLWRCSMLVSVPNCQFHHHSPLDSFLQRWTMGVPQFMIADGLMSTDEFACSRSDLEILLKGSAFLSKQRPCFSCRLRTSPMKPVAAIARGAGRRLPSWNGRGPVFIELTWRLPQFSTFGCNADRKCTVNSMPVHLVLVWFVLRKYLSASLRPDTPSHPTHETGSTMGTLG